MNSPFFTLKCWMLLTKSYWMFSRGHSHSGSQEGFDGEAELVSPDFWRGLSCSTASMKSCLTLAPWTRPSHNHNLDRIISNLRGFSRLVGVHCYIGRPVLPVRYAILSKVRGHKFSSVSDFFRFPPIAFGLLDLVITPIPVRPYLRDPRR